MSSLKDACLLKVGCIIDSSDLVSKLGSESIFVQTGVGTNIVAALRHLDVDIARTLLCKFISITGLA